jgi:hypothetical protein
MTSSGFWKEREEEFRRHANEENRSLAADWDSIMHTWTFRGGSGVERSGRIFTSLARKAAQGINAAPGSDLCNAWLDSLRGGCGFGVRFHQEGVHNQQRRDYMARSGQAPPVVEGIVETVSLLDDSVETRTRFEGITGTIERIFETSADYCMELGSQAPPDTVPAPPALLPSFESSSQIPAEEKAVVRRNPKDFIDASKARSKRSYAKLAAQIGISKDTLYAITKETRWVSDANYRLVAQVCGCHPEDLHPRDVPLPKRRG